MKNCYGIVRDNSFNLCIDFKITTHIDLVYKLVKIISEPYHMIRKFICKF